MNQIINDFKKETGEVLISFQGEISGVRSNRPHPGLIENIKISYADSLLPLKQIASISISPPNSLIVQPWDKSAISFCEKSINAANLGVSAANEGTHLRVVLPELSSERREELIKLVNKKAEEFRVKTRINRDEARKKIQKSFDSKEMGEDDKFRLQEEIQKEADIFNKKIEELIEAKEEELKK